MLLAVVRRPPAATAGRPPHLELYLRDLEARGYASATISCRLSTVAGLFKYAVIDELVATNPTLAVTRPRVRWEGQRRTVLHPLEFAAVLSAARRHGDTAHALVALLGLLGLRVSEACNARVQDLRYAGGYELLRVLGKGREPSGDPPADPGAPRRQSRDRRPRPRPILLSGKGDKLPRGAASRLLHRVVREAGVTSPASPHTLRRTFCTARLISGVPLRDMQHAMRHADARTTIRYDMARANLDRHAAHSVAAYLAGMAIGTSSVFVDPNQFSSHTSAISRSRDTASPAAATSTANRSNSLARS